MTPFCLIFLSLLGLSFLPLSAALIAEKALICGIGKNIEKTIPNVIHSATLLGEQFSDYRIIIYENNSKDKSKKLLQKWASRNPRVLLTSEYLDKKTIAAQCKMKVYNRTETIARARNKVLDIAMKDTFRDYAYIIWVDLDLHKSWDITNIVDTILHPEQEWDAVLGNGAYDLFALRDPEFPIGFELIGDAYYHQIDRVRSQFILDPSGPWRKVYSAFGGLGIYKRSAIKKCRYSGVVTKDLEKVVGNWLERAYLEQDVCFLDTYEWILSTSYIVDLYKKRLSFSHRDRLPERLGMRLHNENGLGEIIWFSCTKKRTLPWTCEHITFHASMIVRGHDKIFINPRIITQ